MGTTIVIFILAIIVVCAILSIRKRIKYGSACCGTRDAAPKKIRVKDKNKSHYPYTYTLNVDGMHCSNCARHVENALKVVDYLSSHPKVEKVNHPSLPDHPDHQIYNRLFPNGAGSIFTFDIKGGAEEAQAFIDRLQIFSLLANVADVKSLVIHPASTTHSQLTESELAEQGIKPNTVRLSIGIESINDIISDIEQAFED